MKKGEMIATSMTTLANATELSACVIEKIAGEEVSNRLDGKTIRRQDLTDLIAAKLQKRLNTHVAI